MPAPVAIFVSGGGRTLLNLADRIAAGDLAAEIRLVIASKHCPAAEHARARRLPVLVVPGVIDPAVLSRILSDHSVTPSGGWLVLAGYVKYLRIPPAFQNRVVNIHPALLPSFGGRGMFGLRVHQAVIDAGCKVSGCTVHLVDDEYDHGPILAQRACEVRDDDTAQTLADRVFELEKDLYPRTLSRLFSGLLSLDGRRARIIER